MPDPPPAPGPTGGVTGSGRSLLDRLPFARRGPGSLYRRLRSIEYLATRDRAAVRALMTARLGPPAWRRLDLVRRFVATTNALRAYHTQAELLAVAIEILSRRRPVVVEAGCGKGASTAKLSLAVAMAGGSLDVYDSFRGLPENDEVHRNLDGRSVRFRAGAFAGRRAEVERNLSTHGAPEVCRLHKGWFDETLPGLTATVDIALVDVDLLASVRSCLVAIVPRLAVDGVLFTQDGHLEAVVDLLASRSFWTDEVGVAPPAIDGLGRRKFLVLRPASSPGTGVRPPLPGS